MLRLGQGTEEHLHKAGAPLMARPAPQYASSYWAHCTAARRWPPENLCCSPCLIETQQLHASPRPRQSLGRAMRLSPVSIHCLPPWAWDTSVLIPVHSQKSTGHLLTQGDRPDQTIESLSVGMPGPQPSVTHHLSRDSSSGREGIHRALTLPTWSATPTVTIETSPLSPPLLAT